MTEQSVAKICTKCGTEKPLNQFSKTSRHGGTYRSHCRQCINAYASAYGFANRARLSEQARLYRQKKREAAGRIKPDAPPGEKFCTKCGVCKPLEDFNRAKNHRDGRRSECRACKLIQTNAWRDRNKDRVNACYHARQQQRESSSTKDGQ